MPEVQPSYSQIMIMRVSNIGRFEPVVCSQPPQKFDGTCGVCKERAVPVTWYYDMQNAVCSWNILAATAYAVFVLLQVAVQQ
jgi:hypothetical protein